MRPQLLTITFVLLYASILPSSAQKPLSKFDLRAFGVRLPAEHAASDHRIELLFLSSSRLLVFDQGKHLAVLDTNNGTVLREKNVDGNAWGEANRDVTNGTESLVQRVSEGQFAIADRHGISICNAELQCHEGPQVHGRFRFSQEGDRFTLGPSLPSNSTAWSAFNLQGTAFTSYSEDPYSNAIPTSAGTFFGSAEGVHFYPAGSSKSATLTREPAPTFGVVDDSHVLYLSGPHHQPIVLATSGSETYRLNLNDLPRLAWNAAVVPSAQGRVFGLTWTANTTLLNPLACIDACPPAGIAYLKVYSFHEGKLIRSLSWDPRPWNLYVTPALSPDGKLAAVVQGVEVAVYPIQ